MKKKALKTSPCCHSDENEFVYLSAPEVPRCWGGGGGRPRAIRICFGVDGGHLLGHLSYQALSAGHPPSPGTSFPEGQVDSLLSIISSQRERFRARNQELEGVGGVGRVAGGAGAGCFYGLRGIYHQPNAGSANASKRKTSSAVSGTKGPPNPSVLLQFKDRSKPPLPCRCAWGSKRHIGNVVWGKNPIALQTEVQLKMTSSKPAGWPYASRGGQVSPQSHQRPPWLPQPFFSHGGTRFVNGSGLGTLFSGSWDDFNRGAVLIQRHGILIT